MNIAAKQTPIAEILPHRDGMLLLDELLSFDSESACALYHPRSDAWYADHAGNMPAWIGIELMAQTIAAHVGQLKRQQGQAPKMGALLGTRRFTSSRPSFQAGSPLKIHSQLLYRDESGLGAYDCRICIDEEEIATATLKVFEPDDFQSFTQMSHP